MALPATGIVEINASATAGNVNGGGFNPANAGMLTDLTTDTNTANTAAPVVSSASYNFAAGDVNHWLYIKTGTNWTPGWYKIMSVASNKATLSAAVGSANVEQLVNNLMRSNTVIGCATVGTPTGGTFTIDYSRSTAAKVALTNFASVNSSAVLTSVSAPFTPVMVGNYFNLNSGTNATIGWYEITVYTSTSQVTIDRDCAGAADLSAGVGKVGGAISLGSATASLDDNVVFSSLVTSSTTGTTRYFIKGSATYTLGVAVTQTAGNAVWPVIIEGYATSRGDRPTGSTMPILACGANAFTFGGRDHCYAIEMTGTGTSVALRESSSDGIMQGCKVSNLSTTAARAAISGGGHIIACEVRSYRGIGIQLPANIYVPNSYFYNTVRHSDVGFAYDSSATGTKATIVGNIVEGAVTYSINATGTAYVGSVVMENTFYGAENKLGVGLNIVTGTGKYIAMNNLFCGLVTGIAHADVQASCYDDYNNFYNNTNDISVANHWQKGKNTLAVNPQFDSVTQIVGTTATTTAGDHLVQAGATFITSGVTAGRDAVLINSGTGVTAGYYPITSVDSETQITVGITLAANATADKNWRITVGHSFKVGANLKAVGYPGVFPGSSTQGYKDIGAVQQQEKAGGSSSYII